MISNPLYQHHTVTSFVTESRCQEIIEKSNKHGHWTSNRHTNYPTTDIPIDDIQQLDVNTELEKIKEICKDKYNLESSATVKPYDIFVVKYDAAGQNHLNLHRDSSDLSFILLLSNPSDFEGGGTFYELQKKTVTHQQGDLTIHCGKLRHAGVAITKGTRYILIGFMEVGSKYIRKKRPDEPELSNDLCDKRHLDFLWKHPDTLPINLDIRIINLKRRPEKLKKCIDCINRLDVPANWTIHIEPIIANEGTGTLPYNKWKTETIANTSLK